MIINFLDSCVFDLDYLANESFYKLKSAEVLKSGINNIPQLFYSGDADDESNGEENGKDILHLFNLKIYFYTIFKYITVLTYFISILFSRNLSY